MSDHKAYFVILGLDAPPKDRKEIKRAYSRQLKLTRPEDDPEGFMRLRDAHDTGLLMLARAARTSTVLPSEIDPVEPTEKETSLTYGDMLPASDLEPDVSPTSYSIGPTPSLDAPVQFSAASKPEPSQNPPVLLDIKAILESPVSYNDRESWNQLFRKARQLDIDAYVEFESRLMEGILKLHGYFDEDAAHFDQPEKRPQIFSPSITASLFKTMAWDQVGRLSYQKANQIDWLSRRMQISRMSQPVVEPSMTNQSPPAALGRWFWPALGLLIALALLVDLLT